MWSIIAEPRSVGVLFTFSLLVYVWDFPKTVRRVSMGFVGETCKGEMDLCIRSSRKREPKFQDLFHDLSPWLWLGSAESSVLTRNWGLYLSSLTHFVFPCKLCNSLCLSFLPMSLPWMFKNYLKYISDM